MGKVSYVALNSANVKITNESDTTKVYNIESSVNVSATKEVSSIDNGRVLKNGVEVASFSSWAESMLNVVYQNVELEEQCTILEAINGFITDVKDYIKNEFSLN